MAEPVASLASRLSRLNRESLGEVRKVLQNSAESMESRGKTLAITRLNQRTGALARSIKGTAKKDALVLKAGGTKRVPYALIQEEGGTIRATNKPYLHFRLPDGGWARVKSVTLRGRFYLRDAALAEVDPLVARIEERLVAALEGAA